MYTQTKPARRLGADITQSTLQTTLDQAGIDRNIANLSYAEKRLVIITSLLNQVQEATNDWGKTIKSPANQTRILSEQWERLTRTLGSIFLPIVYKILPYVNAIMMVLTEIAKILADIMARIFGFDPKELDFGAGVGNNIDILGDKMDNTTKKSEKLKNSMSGLRSFDKIINISTPKNNDSGAGTGGVGISSDIMSMANKAMDEYNKKIESIQMKATKIRDNIMEWLGFTKEIDGETGEVSFKFDHITSGTVLGALAIGGSIYKGVRTIWKILSKIGLLKMPKVGDLFEGLSKLPSLVSKINPIVGVILAIGGALYYAYTHVDKFKEKVDRMVSSVVTMFDKLYKKIKIVVEFITKKLEPVWDVVKKAWDFALGSLWDVFLGTFGAIANIIEGVSNIISSLIDGDIQGAFDNFIGMLKNLKDTFAEMFGNILKKAIEFVPNLIGKLGELLIWVAKLPFKFLGFILEAVDNIEYTILHTDWLKLGKDILNGIVNGLINIGKAVINFGSKMFDKIKEVITQTDWLELGKKILDGIIDGLYSFGKKIKEWGSSFGNAIGDSVKSTKSKGILGSILFKVNGGIYSGGKWQDIKRYDGGGMPNSGQLFWARENGLPEMVGTIGGHTAVMNNDQIVGSVANGVYRAVLSANSQTSKGTGTQVFNIYLDKNKKLATYTLNELQSMAKSNGKPIEIS